ncbi:four-helix bundle copper-binding protein [Bacillus shivajii]|nr:four-helix bundle copper-binding protein [Bacillus shivajii]UCZ55390.1 four-helix bundle copper-binding protein [Bacillus shivajii]
MNAQLEEIYEALEDCVRACNQCYDACLEEEHIDHMRECIRTDRECADFCTLTLKAITTNSPFLKDMLALCAKICRACEKECSKHDHDHCKVCAEACHTCAELCESYS